MATNYYNAQIGVVDASGNVNVIYPITKSTNVDVTSATYGGSSNTTVLQTALNNIVSYMSSHTHAANGGVTVADKIYGIPYSKTTNLQTALERINSLATQADSKWRIVNDSFKFKSSISLGIAAYDLYAYYGGTSNYLFSYGTSTSSYNAVFCHGRYYTSSYPAVVLACDYAAISNSEFVVTNPIMYNTSSGTISITQSTIFYITLLVQSVS